MGNKKTFEENMERLEEIVRMMERGDVPLDKSLALFREGTGLLQLCGKMLDDAELQVNKIVPNSDGTPAEEKFDID